ncbi:Protein JASON [Bienertia sinuspersici]
MGCFLGCFGSSKDHTKRSKNARIPSHRSRDIQNQYNPPTLLVNQEILKKPIDLPFSESCIKQEENDQLNLSVKDKQVSLGTQKKVTFDSNVKECKPQEQVSSATQKKVSLLSDSKEHKQQQQQQEQVRSGTRRKVTFDSNVKEYEHTSFHEAQDIVQEESERGGEKGVDESSNKQTSSSSLSEGGSTLSSLGSFPLNHRYQKCRESDEELDCEVSDVDEDEDEDDEDEVFDDEYSDDEYHLRQVDEFPSMSCSSVESRTKSSATSLVDDGHNDQVLDHGSSVKETRTPVMFRCGARDRAGYVHSVLNPVENTAQWKSVKVKGTPPAKQQKENFVTDLGFQQPSSYLDEPKNNHQLAVNASLSTWLISSQKTPPTKEPISSAASVSVSVSSHGSNSVRSHEERPILGALTVEEELQQFSASSSLRRSPSRSPDERPLVGVQWNDRTPAENPGSVSSFKGIPNTTSKYREDKRVNWHSTPFETRLERALNTGAVEGHATRHLC